MKKFVNGLTITRIVGTLVLPLVWIFVEPGTLLLIVFLILLTDFFDGLLARTFKVQSLFGALLDVMADKAFGIMILILIGIYKPMFFIVAVLEIIIALINIIAAIKGATTFSSILGKIKMWILGISTMFALLAIFDNQLYQIIDFNIIKEILYNFMENENTAVIVSASITIGAQTMVAIDYLKHITKEIKENPKKIKYNFKDKTTLKKVLFDTKYYIKNKDLPLSKHLLK